MIISHSSFFVNFVFLSARKNSTSALFALAPLPFPDCWEVTDAQTQFLVAARKVVSFAVPTVPDRERLQKRFVDITVGLGRRLDVQIQAVLLAPHLSRLPRDTPANFVSQIQLN